MRIKKSIIVKVPNCEIKREERILDCKTTKNLLKKSKHTQLWKHGFLKVKKLWNYLMIKFLERRKYAKLNKLSKFMPKI